jgi:nitrate/TMAO reductase-like tetraheme cytochrome c subunit
VKPAEFVAKYGQPEGVTDDWSKKQHLTQQEIGQTLKERWHVNASTNCQTCHR